jgi:post-segregation antitoxin (ccd killing protein)
MEELKMTQNSSVKNARLNLVVPLDLKRKLTKTAAAQGKKISALVRESIEENLARTEQELFQEKMREAYLEMAEENLITVEEFKHADAENL